MRSSAYLRCWLGGVWVLLLAGCGGSAGLPFEPAGPLAAPDPEADGPFPVGVQTFYLEDPARPDPKTGLPRHLTTEVWYPAVQQARGEPLWSYDLKQEVTPENVGQEKYEAVQRATLPLADTRTVRDAAIDRGHGPYPVLIFSHGSNGMRWQSIAYVTRLASHGYVVIAPDHENNTLFDLIRDGFDETAVITTSYRRLDDVKFLLDEFLGRNQEPADFFYDTMDRRRVGVTGHSFGGWTSVCMPCVDSRVKAAVAQCPIISLAIGYCSFEAYPAPLLVMGGTLDRTVPWRDQYCDYQALEGEPPRHLLEIVSAGHFTFSDICRFDLLAISEEIDLGGQVEDALNDGCAAENIPFDDAFQIIDHYAVGFFNLHLRDSPGSQAFLQAQDSPPPFDLSHFYDGLAPDWPDGGC